MSTPLDRLLERLGSGDAAAAERLFVEFEPYLRKAARRHIPPPFRARFDSGDIIQSVWVDVLRGFRDGGYRFTDADHLRGFLFVATRNRVIDRVRQHRNAVGLQEPLGEGDRRHGLASPQPRPSEVAAAGDLWERILARCPAEHRPVLDLRRQGHSLAEIAARTGLHADSIRRILRTLARQFAFDRQPPAAGGGDAR